MVTGSRVEGGAQVLSAGVRKTIQSIKEVVGNHSDSDIYVALKEANMDPNETTQKLLNQDPFHEVKRKRDRKKEPLIASVKSIVTPEPMINADLAHIPVKNSSYSDRNSRRGGYGRNIASGSSREFRVVRDNRVDQNGSAISKPAQSSISTNEVVISNWSTKSNSTKTSGHREPSARQHSSQTFNNPAVPQPKQTKVTMSDGNDRNRTSREKLLPIRNATPRVQANANDPQPYSTSSSSSSVVGVYSSNSDPVHVPSIHSRPAANIGAIRREVGVVGPCRQSSENSAKSSSPQSTPLPNTQSGRDGQPRESTSDQSTQNMAPESASKSISSNQYGSRPHQPMGHEKASQRNKKWKPKASVKRSASRPAVIGTPAKTVSSPPSKNQDVLQKGAARMGDNMSQPNIHNENQNVIIAAHIRVSETDRCRLTFGSLRAALDASTNSVTASAPFTDPSGSVSVSSPESSADDHGCGSPQLEMMNDSVRSSGSNSPASGVVSVHQLTENKESSGPQNYVVLVRNNSPSYTPESLQRQQDTSELPSFSGYDPQMGYDISYFRPIVGETVGGAGLPSSQEVVSSHTTNTIPASTIAMVQQQQQQQQLAQMYPQLHVPHFMPYRQFLSPVYLPPMPVPGYSSSPAYTHPSNGNSYVLMPGNSSHHLTASGVKYGIQQFKSVPAGTSANLTSPAGYAMNTLGVVASPGGHDEASRLKDSFYVPNPQGETSEIWRNPRDLPGLQSGSYYNMPVQTPHPAYLTSHNAGHAPFTAPQSSHTQFPGMYHPPPQPGANVGPHHVGPAMGGSIGVVLGPGGQVGAYQQPQLGHLNWTGNF